MREANIKVIGVGGGGCNAVNKMIEEKVKGAKFYVVNTDIQALNQSIAENKITIGNLGAGSNPEVGEKCATEHRDEIKKAIKGADMVYITCGEGGGTGTGAAPVIAKIAKDMGILTIAIVTKPFRFEGRRRMEQAEIGIEKLRQYVDSVIVVSNEKLLNTIGKKPMQEAFQETDKVLEKGVRAVTELISTTALINLDFADVKSTMTDSGNAIIGIGKAEGADKARVAADRALNSSLLEISPKGAKKAVINVRGSKNISLQDAYEVVQYVKEKTRDDLDVIFGVDTDPRLKDTVEVTIILTDIREVKEVKPVVAEEELFFNTANNTKPLRDEVIKKEKELKQEIQEKSQEKNISAKRYLYKENPDVEENLITKEKTQKTSSLVNFFHNFLWSEE